jgi:hypothetical protein
LYNRMVGNQAIATVIGLAPVVGDVGIAMFKTNFRNAALLEEYLRIRGEEFLKVQADRTEDPAVVKPGAGQDAAEKIPGKSSQRQLSFFRRSPKTAPVVEDSTEDEPIPGGFSKSNNSRNKTKGKGKESSR